MLAEQLVAKTPRGHAALADQFRRASTSIALNIGEGAGEFALLEKARFYRIARRSATESSTLVEVYRRLAFTDDERAAEARRQLVEIVSMLVSMISSMESAASREKARAN